MYFISIISLISLLIPRRFEGIIEHFKVPEDASELYTFYKNMKMKNILKILENNTTTNALKLTHIEDFNDEFPEISLPRQRTSISSVNLTNGGLLDDWNYELYFSN